MLDFAVKLTREQERMAEADVETLRRHGFEDTAIHDIVQIAALFNYYTRLADGLGVDLEPEMPAPERSYTAPVSFAVEGIDHVEVFVRDFSRALAWYRETLGLSEVCRWDPEPIMIGAGGTKLALFLAREEGRPAGAGASRSPHWHRVAWRTDEPGFERAQRHLAAAGVAFRGPVDHGTARSIYFHDPDGNPLEITCYPGPAEPRSG